MISTLAERLADAMKGSPAVTGASLAKACKCKAASVSDWLSGKTKTMEASNLLAAARHLNVDPDWLATGIGVKTRNAGALVITEPMPAYLKDRKTTVWPFPDVPPDVYGNLNDRSHGQVEGFVKALLLDARNLRIRDGAAQTAAR